MKPILTLAFIASLCFNFSLKAQTNFAPAGAEWYHAMPYGVFHSAYAADTTIAGITCRKIVQKAYTANPWLFMGLRVDDHPALFIYNNADTVFVYNRLFSKFTPLYVFNVHAGDTVTLPVLPPEPAYMASIPDSFFSFIVDSVAIATFDTAHLKTVYTSPIDPGNPHYYYTYGRDSAHSYAVKIGTVHGGLMPYCGRCTMITSDAVQFQDSVRCYNDPAIAVKLVTDICGKDYTAVPQPLTSNNTSIFPVPATDYLYISLPVIIPALTATLYNATGVAVYTGNYNNVNGLEINMSQLPAGVYSLRLTPDGSAPITKRVTILK